jgi:hypothetical protein
VKQQKYTTQLQAGLGVIDETIKLLDLWQPGMNKADLYQEALNSGHFPNVSARRLKNLVYECFATRYLVDGDYPAFILKKIKHLSSKEFLQILFLFTARANLIFRDFVIEIYWAKYAGGQSFINKEDALEFVNKANKENKTTKDWSETTIKYASSNLLGCCTAYELLDSDKKGSRKILPYKIEEKTTAFLAYDLHFAGLGDNAIISHQDWQLFGLEKEDVKEELKKLTLKNYYVLQSAGNVHDICWRFNNWEEFLDVFN